MHSNLHLNQEANMIRSFSTGDYATYDCDETYHDTDVAGSIWTGRAQDGAAYPLRAFVPGTRPTRRDVVAVFEDLDFVDG
jgi:hypothetical protein